MTRHNARRPGIFDRLTVREAVTLSETLADAYLANRRVAGNLSHERTRVRDAHSKAELWGRRDAHLCIMRELSDLHGDLMDRAL